MALTSYQALSVVVIVCFVPAVAASALAWYRRSLGRQLCWVYLLALALIRIVAASLQIASDATGNVALAKGARYMAPMGIVPLLLVMLAVIEHIKSKSSKPDGIPRSVWYILNAVHWAAFIVSIIAAARGSNSLSKATVILQAVGLAIQAAISLTFLDHREQFDCSRRLVLSAPTSIPFLTIRVVYGILSTFQVNEDFGRLEPNVFAQAFMQYLMEIIVVALFLVVGLAERANKPRKNMEECESNSSAYEPLNRI